MLWIPAFAGMTTWCVNTYFFNSPTVPDLRTEQSRVPSLVIARDELPRLSLRGAEQRSNLKTDSEQAPQSQPFGTGSELELSPNQSCHSREACPRMYQAGSGNP